jgi:hypothetical protein
MQAANNLFFHHQLSQSWYDIYDNITNEIDTIAPQTTAFRNRFPEKKNTTTTTTILP